MEATANKNRGRKVVHASGAAHSHLKTLAALDGISVEKAHDKYAEPALEKALKRALAKRGATK
jgi:hypothetical protein